MKRNIRTILAGTLVLSFAACQNLDPMWVDPDATSPEIGEIVVEGAPLVYGESVSVSAEVRDSGTPLSHAVISLTVDNSVVFTRTIPAGNSNDMLISEVISIPFQAMCRDGQAEISVEAMNKELKTSSSVKTVSLKRPDFQSIWFTTSVEDLSGAVELKKTAGDGYIYSADNLDFENGVSGYLLSSKDSDAYCWGFDEALSICRLDSETPVTLWDSENTEMKVREITFDALTFEILPLKKEMTVDGVSFLPYKKNPSDEGYVDNTLLASSLSLVQGKEVQTEMVDLDEIMFDGNYFRVEDGKLYYTGATGKVNLYLNKLYSFVFVETENEPLVTDKSYPDVLLANGWGLGRPELWYYNPNWDFGNSVVLYKESETENEYVFRGTVCFQSGANFKLYTGKDWGYEIAPLSISFEGDAFVAAEESGKPGNYNIYMNDPQFKSCVVSVSVVRSKDGDTTVLSSEILRTSESDK